MSSNPTYYQKEVTDRDRLLQDGKETDSKVQVVVFNDYSPPQHNTLWSRIRRPATMAFQAALVVGGVAACYYLINPLVQKQSTPASTSGLTSGSALGRNAVVFNPIQMWQNCVPGQDTCADGGVCCVAPADVSSGKTTCRLPGLTGQEVGCAASSPSYIPAWNNCVSGGLPCANGYTCCIGPDNAQYGKYTCRLSGVFDVREGCQSQSTASRAPTSTSSIRVPAWNNCRYAIDTCPFGYTCCIGPVDASIARYTCRLANVFDLTEGCMSRPPAPSVSPSASASASVSVPVNVAAWNNCRFGVDSCQFGYTCCIGPVDAAISKYTCRIANVFGVTEGCMRHPPSPSGSASASPAPTATNPPARVPAWNNCRYAIDTCPIGYTCCIGPADASIAKYTCRLANVFNVTEGCMSHPPSPSVSPSASASVSASASASATASPTASASASASASVSASATVPVSSAAPSSTPWTPVNVAAWNICRYGVDICPAGFTCCVGPGGWIPLFTCRYANVFGVHEGCATTQPPAVSSAAASVTPQPSSSVPAASSSVAPASSSVAPASSSVAPASSSVAPASSSVAPASSSVAPASSSVAPASSSVAVASPSPSSTVAP